MRTDAPRRLMIVSMATVLSLAMVGSSAPAGAQTDPTAAPDLATWCQARVDAEAAFASEDRDAAAAALDQLAASAPDDIASDSRTVATLLKKRGEDAFESPKFRRASAAVDAYVAASCGFTAINVAAVDYQFLGVPASVPAGNATITLSNDAPKEEHEAIVVRVNDDVTMTAEELLALPEKKAEKLVTFKGATFAPPGETGTTVTSLEPGRYVMVCFVPVGGKKKGAPHFTKGMVTEFQVAAA